jgi:hypothetical protein
LLHLLTTDCDTKEPRTVALPGSAQ